MKRIFFCIIILLAGMSSVSAQSEMPADTVRTAVRGEASPEGMSPSEKELLPDVKNYDGFLLDMGLMNLSTPNAAYKINSLVKKGYVEKIQSTTDRREYFLRPTQKYIDYYSISYSYLHTVIERVRKRFPAEDCDKMEQMLSVISTELMPELDMLAKCRHPEAPKSEE